MANKYSDNPVIFLFVSWKILTLIIIGFISLFHLINWLLAKGTIWVMLELANINWYGKFWAVYVALIILEGIFKDTNINNK